MFYDFIINFMSDFRNFMTLMKYCFKNVSMITVIHLLKCHYYPQHHLLHPQQLHFNLPSSIIKFSISLSSNSFAFSQNFEVFSWALWKYQ